MLHVEISKEERNKITRLLADDMETIVYNYLTSEDQWKNTINKALYNGWLDDIDDPDEEIRLCVQYLETLLLLCQWLKPHQAEKIKNQAINTIKKLYENYKHNHM